MKATTVCILLFLVLGCHGRKGFGPGEQEWDYVKVRPQANIFWWLYFTTANVRSVYDRPLVIWLQGGPGGSSTSYGNFEEIGPIDSDLKERNYTWVKDYNVLFIDNPVGTGFSYAESSAAYAKTNAQIADDLVECMRGFLKKLPNFATVPTYITTESYGGKMGAEFALVWYKAQKEGTIKSNLKGVALGDAWISPIDSVMTWAPFLLATAMVDTDGYNKINAAAQLTKKAVEGNEWSKSTYLWAYTENVIMDNTNNIDFYNILFKVEPVGYMSNRILNTVSPMKKAISLQTRLTSFMPINRLMNGPVREALGLNVTHGAQSGIVFKTLEGDFMKPVVHIVERLLNETDLNVFVYNGHMDLIVDTPGTVQWVERLKWKDANRWANSKRGPLVADNIIEGYVKSYGNFGMYWINRAGHMVPRDNPAAMAEILKEFTSNARM